MTRFTEADIRRLKDKGLVVNDPATDGDAKGADASATEVAGKAKGETPPTRMNQTEARYAARLDADPEVEWFIYETFGVRVAKGNYYYPDFLVMTADGQLAVHEVKGGYIRDDAKPKFRAASEVVPVLRWEMWQWKGKEWNRVLTLP